MTTLPPNFHAEIVPLLAPRVGALVRDAVRALPGPLEEIRLRQGGPIELLYPGGDRFVTATGGLTPQPERGALLSHDDMSRTFQLIAQGSVYAWEEEVRAGFLTIRGGHRVGIAGRVTVENGRVRTVKHVGSLNIRIAREVVGCAAPLIGRLVRGGRLLSSILISPPQAGKTTVLRDLIRAAATGDPSAGLPGLKVGVVDERSEIAGCALGVPGRDVGPRTDVLDGCPKAEGMMMLIRSLSPDVVAVDEIGRPEDADAVMEALHAGVAVLATAHGQDLADIARRPALAALLHTGAFERAVILSRSRGPGTVEDVVDLGTWRARREDARSAG